MATLTTTLTLNTSDATSDALKISASDSLTVTNPAVNIARQEIASGSDTTLLDPSVQTADTYLYIKNIDTTNYVDVKDGGGSPVTIAELGAGEYLFLPLKGATGIKLQANSAACVVEYGYWTKS